MRNFANDFITDSKNTNNMKKYFIVGPLVGGACAAGIWKALGK